MIEPCISVLICSINAAKYARVTASYERLLASYPHEIIGIHDARSLAEGYNRAVQASRGEWLLFSHDDVEIVSSDLAPAILRGFPPRPFPRNGRSRACRWRRRMRSCGSSRSSAW
jgi:hypothetical protein